MVVPFLQNSTFTGLISTRDFGTSQDWQTGYLNTISFTTTGINDSIANYLSSNNVIIKAAVINENVINTGELVSFNGGTAIGSFSFAANDARAEGTTTFAVNDGTAIGEHSSAQNRGTSIGIFSIATGHETQAIGDFSHVEGTFTAASGVAAHAEGSNTQATGNYSHAEGEGSQALEENSHAEGYQTVALGKNSHAQGAFTIAGGENSHAGGAYAQTIYDRSWVWKGSTITDVLSTTRSDQFMVSAEGGIVLSNKVGIGTDSIDNALTVIGTISTSEHGDSSTWFSNYTTVLNNSATTWNYQGTDLKNLSGNWQNSYTAVTQSSSTWFGASAASVNYAHTNFLPLSGGIISGPTRINNNLSVFGNLTATGTTTFANTVFSTTSSLSVVHIGSGPALWVGNNGDGDIASFYDIDQNIEVLHVGGINGSNPNVGIKTSTPNKDFTVKGEISASNTIYEGTGNSNQWNQAHSIATAYQNISANWLATYLTVSALSASWEESADIIPTVTNYLSTNRVQVSALIIGNTFSGINSLTISGNISGNNLRTSFNQGSATGLYSFAEGSGKAFGDYSHAEGVNTIASGYASHAEGNFTVASGSHSHAEGDSAIASGLASHAEGDSAIASGYASHAEGDSAIASGYASHAAGYRATAAQDYTYAWSDGNLGTVTQNISTTRSGQYMVSATGGIVLHNRVGIGTDNNQNALTVVGTISTVNGTSNQWNSTTTTVQTNSATNWNYQGTDIKNLSGNWQSTYQTVCALSATWNSGGTNLATVINYLSTNNVTVSALTITNSFSGIDSLTINGNISGNNLRTSFNQGSATGDWSFAANRSRAFGNFSYAEGVNSTASGITSHAEGLGTLASGNRGHSEGQSTIASGDESHAEGWLTVAARTASHAAGFRATAAHDISYAWSDGNVFTNTANVSTTRSGQYMVSASGGMFIPGRVGIGTDSLANALTIVGNISATGSVYSTPTLRVLASNEFDLNADLFSTFVKQITGPNAFTYSNFTSGRSITLYLSAGHLNFSRHYFPQTTFISQAGDGNTVYTFQNYITKIVLQNIGTQYIGTTDLIPINIEQIIPVAPLGPSIILDDQLGYIKQEDGSYILL